MNDAELPRNSNEDLPDRAPEEDSHQEAPGYDPTQEGYTGISEGTLGSLGDAVAARDLAEMIVDTIRDGLLVLDTDLRVRAANESFYDAFRVKPEDTVGHLVYELGDGQWDLPELRELLEDILPENEAFDGYEVEHDFEEIGHRVVPLNARRLDRHEMILLSVEDVTERRERERELRDAHEALRDAHEALKGQTRVITAGQDAMGPPEVGEEIQATLPNSFHVVFPDAAHGLAFAPRFQPCLNEVITSFFADPERQPNEECVAALPRRPISVALPRWARERSGD